MSPIPEARNIVAGALSTPPIDGDSSDFAILEATIRCLTRYGMDRMTVEDVARAAGVGRATVFRRFESKDDLIRQAFALELQRLVAEFGSKGAAFDDPFERLVELTVDMVRVIRTHPVAQRLVEDDNALPLQRDPRISAFQLEAVQRMLSQTAEELDVEIDTTVPAELLLRFFASMWMTPDIGTGADDEAVTRQMVQILLAPLAAGR